MDSATIGPFIRQLRLDRRLTQKELAAKLNVTDKAVSKWERSASLPDVALLLPLSEALGVSVTELLAGGRAPDAPPPDPAGALLTYASRTAPQRWERLRLWLFAGLTGTFLLAAAVCWICDAALNGALTWSLVVCCSLALAWAVLLPLLTARRHPLPLALAALSAVILPYLWLLGDLLGEPRVFQLGLPIAPAAVLYLWAVWAQRRRLRRKWRAAGELLQLTAVLDFYVSIVVYPLTGSWAGWTDILLMLALSAACFLADFVLRRLEASGREKP